MCNRIDIAGPRGSTPAVSQRLRLQAIEVLQMIAAGNTYEQILAAYPDLTYLDIFGAAGEAVEALRKRSITSSDAVVDIHKTYPRAYEKWTEAEEQRLAELIARGLTVAQMAIRLQRQRSAIRSRILRLHLVSRLSSQEQSELARISKLDPVNADPSVDESEDGAGRA